MTANKRDKSPRVVVYTRGGLITAIASSVPELHVTLVDWDVKDENGQPGTRNWDNIVPLTSIATAAAEKTDQTTTATQAPLRFLNHYRCPKCGRHWSSLGSYTCDDDCSSCGKRYIAPHYSRDVDPSTQEDKP